MLMQTANQDQRTASQLHPFTPATKTPTSRNQGSIIGMDFRLLDYQKTKSSN